MTQTCLAKREMHTFLFDKVNYGMLTSTITNDHNIMTDHTTNLDLSFFTPRFHTILGLGFQLFPFVSCFSLHLCFYFSAPGASWSSPFPFVLRVLCERLSLDMLCWLPESKAYPAPLPSNFMFDWFLVCSFS